MSSPSDAWCILRISGGQTLALAEYLNKVGLEAWTPRRTFRRVLQAGRKGERKLDIDAPILPTFVFARADNLAALWSLTTTDTVPHPPFSIFQLTDRQGQRRIGLVADSEIQGLREAEEAAADALQRQRDADTREEAEAIRIAALRSERERLKAQRIANAERIKVLRAEARTFEAGAQVDVAEAPALVGLVGTVVETFGKTAIVSFGSVLQMKIEAWQLSRHRLDGPSA